MQIDWLTVIAQIINFLILVWLLKRFLYQPIINAMDRREQRITERLREAEQREQAAEESKQDYLNKMEALEQDREALMDEARQAAETKQRELLDEARAEAAEKRSHWQHQVLEEKQNFLRSLKHEAAESIQRIARRALADLADTELEEQIIHAFIHRLKTLDTDSRHAIAAAESAQITTSFELDSAIRGQLTRTIHEQIGKGIDIYYRVSPELLSGIELSVAGRRLSWTLAEYLRELEERIQAQLEAVHGGNE